MRIRPFLLALVAVAAGACATPSDPAAPPAATAATTAATPARTSPAQDPPPPGIIAAARRQPAPALRVTAFDGSTVTLDQFRGRPAVVSFFESWCPVCAVEQPDLSSDNMFLAFIEAIRKTIPDAIRDIHVQYFLAGADICETNTFSATTFSYAGFTARKYSFDGYLPSCISIL